MSRPSEPPKNQPVPSHDFLAGLLSYLIPGMGQCSQGRYGKGILFLVCLYGMFFYGMYLGSWKNVYIYAAPESMDRLHTVTMRERLSSYAERLQFGGQFWIGMAAWPAIWQYASYDPRHEEKSFLGDFQRLPSEDALNDLQRDSDKIWDLAWVYTVIAGVLNILVVYDAFAGPAFVTPKAKEQSP